MSGTVPVRERYQHAGISCQSGLSLTGLTANSIAFITKKTIAEQNALVNDYKSYGNRRRPLNEGMAGRFKMQDELREPVADEEREQQKTELKPISQAAEIISFYGHAGILSKTFFGPYDADHTFIFSCARLFSPVPGGSLKNQRPKLLPDS